MNKAIAFFVTLIVMTKPIHVAADNTHIDLRISAFYPFQQLIREIYGDCLVNLEAEVGRCLFRNYELWGNISYLSTNGETQALHTSTEFTNANLSCGAKYLFYLAPRIRIYVGAGINGAYVYVNNDSPYVKRNNNKCGLGGVFKMGVSFRPLKYLFCELFSDLLYQRIQFENSVQIGGIKLGAGLGYHF